METSVIVGLLVIAAVWGVYLLPSIFGERGDASISSTEEFDRWTHSMAHVQKQTPAELASHRRDLVRLRRRRTLAGLSAVLAGTFAVAWFTSSLAWLLVALFLTSLLGLYLAVLAQVKKRRLQRLKVRHVAERPTEWEEPQVRVIAN